jgi:hypothetical protein
VLYLAAWRSGANPGPETRLYIGQQLPHKSFPWREDQDISLRHEIVRGNGDHATLAGTSWKPNKSGAIWLWSRCQVVVDYVDSKALVSPEP